MHVSYEISKVIFDVKLQKCGGNSSVIDHIASVVYYIAVNFRLCAMVREH